MKSAAMADYRVEKRPLARKEGARAAGGVHQENINGKIDLTQAEAVIGLINSKTDEGSRAGTDGRQAFAAYPGSEERTVGLIAHIEAVLDYPNMTLKN